MIGSAVFAQHTRMTHCRQTYRPRCMRHLYMQGLRLCFACMRCVFSFYWREIWYQRSRRNSNRVTHPIGCAK